MLMELFFFKSRWLKCGLFDNILLTLFTYTCTIIYMLICRGHQLLGDAYIQVSDKLSVSGRHFFLLATVANGY